MQVPSYSHRGGEGDIQEPEWLGSPKGGSPKGQTFYRDPRML